MRSPNSCPQKPRAAAAAFARRSRSAPANAPSSAKWLVPSSCMPVSSPSHTRGAKPAPMRRRVQPAPATSPPLPAALSSARTTVVPAAITRRARDAAATVAGGTS